MSLAEREPTKLATYAMATRFELVLDGDDPVRLRAAGEEAIEEIERLDKQLSRFRPDSDISWINAHAAKAPVKVEPGLFELLKRAQEIWQATGGAFDITIAPLMRAWGFTDGGGKVPDPGELAKACEITGMQHVTLDENDLTVSFDRPGIGIDLGAIGKGYAIEQAAGIVRANGVTCALLHGGTSTVYAIGSSLDHDDWSVALRAPSPGGEGATHDLCNSALSVSAPHGRSFTVDGQTYGHMIDPRTGQPVMSPSPLAGEGRGEGAKLAAVWGPSPTDCDALSTALLVLGDEWLPAMRERFAGYDGLVRV